MGVAAEPRGPASWLRLPSRSARLRLALIYSSMFLALGTVIVVIIFLIGSAGAVGSSSVSAVPVPGAGADVLHAAAHQQHNADVNRLLAGAWVTLALTAVVSAVLGWFIAQRVLSPLRRMTLATRTISAGNLHQRLALTGPDDEFKQLGDTIDDLLARLQASFAAQRRFVANAAHELRTPLTLERTLLQVALADPDATTATLRAACEELLSTGRDHERLLDSLLTLASSERGLERRERLELAAIVRTLLEVFDDELTARSLTVAADLEPAPVSGDPALLERLAANLLDNAIRYNAPGGSLTVRTGLESDRAVLTIANSGPTVAPEEVEGLFDPFRRLHADRTTADGHHGLGLSIVRAVALAHDAALTASANPGGGLTVSVAFTSGRTADRADPPPG